MAEINAHMFREYDIRGVAGKDLTPECAELIGKAFGTYLIRKKQRDLVLGRDARLSSPTLHDALVNGINSTGVNVIDIGLATWGFVNYSLRKQTGNAVFISASHNPAEYNGFKLVLQEESVPGSEIKKLLALIQNKDFEISQGNYYEVNLFDEYLNFLSSKVTLNKFNNTKKSRFVVDYGNGMAAMVGPKLFKQLGLNPIELFNEVDCTFPNHLADPSHAETLKDLVAKVKETNADFGIAFDGDGDRLGVVDENGNIFAGDQLLAIFAKDVLKGNPGGKIVLEVKCSQALKELIAAKNGVAIESPVGHTYIERALVKEKALLGGELSGHFFFADKFYGIDDAVYNALRFIQIVNDASVSVSHFLDDYPKYFASPEIRPFCSDETKEQIVSQIAQEFKNEGYNVSTLDGVKVYFENGWGGLRKSNTAPLLSFRCEGKTKEAMEKIREIFATKLKKHGIEI